MRHKIPNTSQETENKDDRVWKREKIETSEEKLFISFARVL
jgi:hypothetical protein